MRRSTPTLPVSEPVELLIDHVGAQGDGVAPDHVFVPLTLGGERVMARRQGDRAELESILSASQERVEPPCPHFGACGGCALQHWDHAPYIAWKAEQLRLSLSYEKIETDILAPFASPPGSRRRIALHARKRGHDTIIGYKARRSWDVVEIEVCPISDPRLVAALPKLRAFASVFFEHPKSAPTLHVTITDTGLDVDVTGVEAKSGGLSPGGRMRAAELARGFDFARATLSNEVLYQSRRPMVSFGDVAVALPPGGFLQAVAEAETAMADFAVEALAGATRVADLFCGSGAFTFRLAKIASVLALDASDAAIAAIRPAIATAPGLRAITAEARDLYRRPLLSMEMKKIDAVLFDPPRAGALEQAGQIAAAKGVSKVVGVSCNPGTFARDARALIDGGFKLMRVLPVDQFLWSPHIELVGVFER